MVSGTAFVSNTATSSGAGLYASGAATLTGGRFEANRASTSGGGLFANGTLAVTDTVFVRNSASTSGGGVGQRQDGRIVNGLFVGNAAPAGAAINYEATGGGGADVLFTTIISSTTGAGAGSRTPVGPQPTRAAIQVGGGTVRVVDTIVTGYAAPINTAVSASASEDYNLFYHTGDPSGPVVRGGHTIVGDPAFADAANDDYHLTDASLAVDMGIDRGVDTDLDGTVRPRGVGYDIGAYESPFTHAPDVTIYQTVTPAVVDPGDAITATLTFLNESTDAWARNVWITDVVPSFGLTNVNYTSSGATITPTGPISYTWQVEDLAPGAGGVITLTAAIISDPPFGGTVRNTATVTATGMITPTHDRATVSVTLVVTPALQISKDVEPARLQRGQVVTYTLRVTNTGNINLHTAITDVLPAEIETTDPLSWTPVISAHGGVWTGQVVGTVSPTATGEVANVVRVTSTEGASGIFTRTANSGVRLFLPVLVRGVSSAPDLVVRDLVATTGLVTVTIENVGTGPTGRTFWVDVSFDPSTRPPRLNQPWPTIAAHGIAWGVTKSLAAGERLTLVSSGSDPYYWGPATSSAPPYPAKAKAYVYVDSVDYSTTWGAVLESDEGNNTAGPVRVTVAAGSSAAPQAHDGGLLPARR